MQRALGKCGGFAGSRPSVVLSSRSADRGSALQMLGRRGRWCSTSRVFRSTSKRGEKGRTLVRSRSWLGPIVPTLSVFFLMIHSAPGGLSSHLLSIHDHVVNSHSLMYNALSHALLLLCIARCILVPLSLSSADALSSHSFTPCYLVSLQYSVARNPNRATFIQAFWLK